MSSKNQGETATTPGPVPLPPPNRRASFSQNPSFSTLFGRGSPPRPTADPTLQRRFSWSFAPPKESSSAIDDSDDIAASPSDDGSSRRGSETIGRRLSTTAMSLREALGFKPIDDPTSPGTLKTVLPLLAILTKESVSPEQE
jgi:hypothetical protein